MFALWFFFFLVTMRLPGLWNWLFPVLLLVGVVGVVRWIQGVKTDMARLQAMEVGRPSAPPEALAAPSAPAGLASDGQGFSVVQATDGSIHYGDLSQMLGEATGLHQADAAFQLRRCPGNLLVSGLTQAAAQAFVAKLSDHQIPSLVLPDKDLIQVSTERTVRSLELQSDQVSVSVNGFQEPMLVPLECLLLAQVGMSASQRQETRTETVSAGPQGATRTVTRTVNQTEHTLIADLYARAPSGAVERFRIDARRMNYGSLGERRQTTSAANLRVILGDLMGRAPSLFAGAGVKELLGGQKAINFPSIKDFEGTAEGYLQLIRATELLRAQA